MNEQNFYDELNEDEKIVFNKYKSNTDRFCYNLNDNLRNKTPNREQIIDIEILDGIINKYQNEERIILHRATVENLVLPFIEDNIYRNQEYLSTSTDLESIETHFTNNVRPTYIEFDCAAGTFMAPMQSNPMFGDLEEEALLGRNLQFEIIENRLTDNNDEITSIMGRFYGQNVESLRIIKAKTIE
ncbi:hypothetical protein [Flavobacterium phragmitis]|uniref:ADP-ribosyltransferase exoenzyme n=1 Tax=Flavobacterium phragmitis TaxID=739143 RepID=A0A1I1U235_9FLAO|nr:hypothetical protein [Flavobacterium phragmitis]SFD61900.1 hypothetical protein SAMN05216297_1106 [Flavobacterium phragmitis]